MAAGLRKAVSAVQYTLPAGDWNAHGELGEDSSSSGRRTPSTGGEGPGILNAAVPGFPLRGLLGVVEPGATRPIATSIRLVD